MESSSIWRLPEASKAARMSVRGLPAIPTSPLRPDTPSSSIVRDFWIPQVSGDGQIYYTNTVTGQLSRDLPFDTDDEAFDCDLAGLTSSQSSSRAGTGAGLGFASYGDVDTLSVVKDPSQSQSKNPVEPARPPDPSSSHYPNNPNGALTAPTKPYSPFLLSDHPPGRTRAQTDSSALPSNRHTYRVPGGFSSLPDQVLKRSLTTRESSSTSHPMSMSIDQDPRLFSQSHRPHVARKGSRLKEATTLPILPQLQELPLDEDPSRLLTAIPSLEEVLSPRPPELISELLDRSQQAVRSVITHLQQFGIPRVADDEVIVDRLITAAIASVRDLLYVSGPSFGQIPSGLVPKGSQDQQSTSTASHTLLVPAQRRAIATLSKFLLSARAILNDGPWSTSDSIGNLATDATELEHSVADFVSIAQSCRCDELDCDKGPRHLQGYFSAPHAGLGKAGAGAAGAWKGFGWVTIDGNEEAPRRSLDGAVLNDIVGFVLQVQDKLNEFVEALRASAPADVVTPAGLRMMNELSSLLYHLGDLHVARHVDIEPVDQAELDDGARYLRTVEKARVLVRSFEATTQAVYDDGAALLTTTQRIRRVEECETWRGRDEHYDTLEALNSSLDFNLQVLRQTLESLLVIVQEQTYILERSNKSPIEWRMSQRSLMTTMLAEEALNSTNNDLYDTNNDETEDILRNVASIEITTPIAETSAENGQLPMISDTAPWADYEDRRIIRTPPRQDKIRAFFGDDAPSHYLITLNAEAKPWYLRPTYDPNDVLVDPDGTTRGGTVAGLVERLTAHEYADPKFSKAFLMTYKTFTTLDELFRLLVERFWIQPPEGLNPPELVEWRKLKQQIIRIRVINTIKSMVQDDDVLERDDAYILDRMMEFVSHDEVITLPAAKQLMVIIKRAQRGRDPNKVTISTALDPPPPPIVPRRMELLDIDVLELARQLTITESQLYQKIRPSECLRRSKESKTDHHDNIANFIRRSNRVANWVAYAILCKDEPRRRASIMKHFISVADRCRHIQNFSTMLAIVSGLNSSPIRRLKRSWEQVGTRYMSQLETCETTINSYKTYNVYRYALAKVSPPCVPFVGVFLTALTHIQDGSKDSLPNNLVNFRKRQKTSEVIQDLQRWQTQPHNFHPLPSVLVYLDDVLGQFGDKDVSDVFWRLSLEREPREKEEEKLARMLHESGFF